jgi:hypothetical protein
MHDVGRVGRCWQHNLAGILTFLWICKSSITIVNQRDERFVDAERKCEWRHNGATFSFGKYKGHLLREVAKEEPGFLEWMLTRDFGAETKAIVGKALKGRFPKRAPASVK